jgi:hypothetical protein
MRISVSYADYLACFFCFTSILVGSTLLPDDDDPRVEMIPPLVAGTRGLAWTLRHAGVRYLSAVASHYESNPLLKERWELARDWQNMSRESTEIRPRWLTCEHLVTQVGYSIGVSLCIAAVGRAPLRDIT